MQRRVFIFGANGMLGWLSSHYLLRQGFAVIPITREKFDVGKDSLEALVDSHTIGENDVLINAIGLTNRQVGVLPDQVFLDVNGKFPLALDAVAGKTGCKLVHITTDCVFNGTQGGYWESEEPSAKDIYAVSKHMGESLQHGVVLRTSLVGIEQDHFRNLISWVITQNGKTIEGYTNHTWNGITTLQCAKIFESFMQSDFPEPGLYHIFSRHIVTKHELITMIANVFDIKARIIPFRTELPVLRHLTSVKTLCKQLNIPDIERQLEEMREYCDTDGIQWKSI